MSDKLYFQDAIQRLNTYWSAQECLLWQPYNTEVGAGTMNPATFLRVLGPEPWHVAYVEPSVRPDDSRYGDNPNRIQMHTQYQVILKPDPGCPQELYLGSLEALGIDQSRHDIRFVEDNWESPALGAWGLGWEVWLDGLEISQFTYFQQAGGVVLNPISVELTYGLERILMALQGADHFKNIAYGPGLSYGEVLAENEYEMSCYNLDAANVERVRQLFELYEAEARMLLAQNLALPAYSFVLKTSHAFNVLDARGAIGVTERARFFARMRDLSREVANVWVRRRTELEFPLGNAAEAARAKPPDPVPEDSELDRPRNFVLEIGTEELPPSDVVSAMEQLGKGIEEALAGRNLDHGPIEVVATPRRLTILVSDLAGRQRAVERVARGPRVSNAFDASGQPTKAALGFAKANGLAPSDLERQKIGGEEYMVAIVSEPTRPAATVLADVLPSLIAGLKFAKSMRWNQSNVAFSRPIRWLLALRGDHIVPFSYADLASGRTSRGFRNAAEPTFEVASADQYLSQIEARGIVIRPEVRGEKIWTTAQRLAAEVGGSIPEEAREGLLPEVVHLVEAPTPLRGDFAPEYLDLPREVLVTVMKKHQRFFAVEDGEGRLLPHFIAVANGSVDAETVRTRNQAVIRARFADANFFYKNDRARTLDSFRGALSGLMFQARLGSMLDKNERLEALLPGLASMFGLTDDEAQIAGRAAHLAKADLASQLVVEFTDLAGTMGRDYARRSGERPEVAEAIYDHVLPRGAGDLLPRTRPGLAVGVADRLDTLVGLFAVGLAPKSSADPFALRRAAVGLVQTLIERNVSLDLEAAVSVTAAVQPVPVTPEIQKQVLEFIRRRLEQWLLDRGERNDLVQAVLAERGHNPASAWSTLRELAGLVETARFASILTAYSRPARIATGPGERASVDPDLFELAQERSLWAAFRQTAPRVKADMSVVDLVAALEPLAEPITHFFDNVFVMVDNVAVRQNRLAMLSSIAELPRGIVDLKKIEGF